MKKITLLVCFLAAHQAAYSLQQPSRQFARLTPRAAQVMRPSLVRPIASATPASWQPSARSSAVAQYQAYEQSHNTGSSSSFSEKLLYASPLVSVGFVATWDRKPVPVAQALKLVQKHAQEVIEKVIPRAEAGSTDAAAVQFSWLPGYIVKLDGESRKAGEKILRGCIEKHHLDLIILPQHVRFSLPGSDSDFCLCERIAGATSSTINAAQMRQLIILIQETEPTYFDVGNDNIIFTKDGKIALIDTELRGFSHEGPGDYTRGRALQNLRKFPLEPEAEKLLQQASDKELTKFIKQRR